MAELTQDYTDFPELPTGTTKRQIQASCLGKSLQILSLATSITVVGLLGGSLSLYHSSQKYGYGAYSLPHEFEPTAIQMAWPSSIELMPTDVLLGIAAASAITSLCLLALSLSPHLAERTSSLAACELTLAAFYALLWTVGTTAFATVGGDNNLAHHSCKEVGSLLAVVVDYATICRVQTAALALAILTTISHLGICTSALAIWTTQRRQTQPTRSTSGIANAAAEST